MGRLPMHAQVLLGHKWMNEWILSTSLEINAENSVFLNIEMKQMPTEIIQKTKLLLQHTNEHQVIITQEILFEKYLGH